MAKLLDEVRQSIRIAHYSYQIEKTYIYWIVKFIRFHGTRHPLELGVSVSGKKIKSPLD